MVSKFAAVRRWPPGEGIVSAGVLPRRPLLGGIKWTIISKCDFGEVRAEGRALSGTAVRYGDVASFAWGRERIEPGAFAPLGDAILNAQHDRATPLARTDGGGLTLLDSEAALEIRAELPPTRSADDVLELVRAKVMRGLSIEFVALTERSEANVRIIEACAAGRDWGCGHPGLSRVGCRSPPRRRCGPSPRSASKGLVVMWPFREARAGAVSRDATEVAISALAARAAGKDAPPEALAALEIAASYVGRAFASAVVSGPRGGAVTDPPGLGDDRADARTSRRTGYAPGRKRLSPGVHLRHSRRPRRLGLPL